MLLHITNNCSMAGQLEETPVKSQIVFLGSRLLLRFRLREFFIVFGNVWHPGSQGNKPEEVLLLIWGKLPKYLYQLPVPHSIKIFWQFSQNGWENLPKVTFPRATLGSVSVNRVPRKLIDSAKATEWQTWEVTFPFWCFSTTSSCLPSKSP